MFSIVIAFLFSVFQFLLLSVGCLVLGAVLVAVLSGFVALLLKTFIK